MVYHHLPIFLNMLRVHKNPNTIYYYFTDVGIQYIFSVPMCCVCVHMGGREERERGGIYTEL